MSFPSNPQDQDQIEILGQLYRYSSAKTAWQKIIDTLPEVNDADTLNGLTDAQFVRSDSNDLVQGDLELRGTVTAVENTVTLKTLVVPQEGSFTMQGSTAQTVIGDQGIITDTAEIENLTVNQTLTVNTVATINDSLTVTDGDVIVTQGLISTPELLIPNNGLINLAAADSSLTGIIQTQLKQGNLAEPATASELNTVDFLINLPDSVDSELVLASLFQQTSNSGGFVSEASSSDYTLDDFESGTLSPSIWNPAGTVGASVVSNGTGTSTTGFATSGSGSTRHVEFSVGAGTRTIRTVSLNTSTGNGVYPDKIFAVKFRYILGSGSNGGAFVSFGSESIGLRVSSNGGVNYTTYLSSSLSSTIWTTYSVDVPLYTMTQAVIEFKQDLADGTGLDEIGLDNIQFSSRDYDEYYLQIGSKTLGRTSTLRLNPINIYGLNQITFRAIRGSNFNGEILPTLSTLSLYYSTNNGSSFSLFSSVTLATSWSDQSIDLISLGHTVGSDSTSTVIFEFRNPNLNRVFGIKNIEVIYDNPNILKLSAPKTVIDSDLIELESANINLGTSTSGSRIVILNTASSSSVNANNSLYTFGGIYAAGIVRSGVAFYGTLIGNASTASSATNSTFSTSAAYAGYLSGSYINQEVGSVLLDGTNYASNAIFQLPLSFDTSQTTYDRFEVEVVGYYYTPTVTPSTTARFYKKWHFGLHTQPATYVIEGATLIYSFNSDATNFPAGAVAAGKAFVSITSNTLYLNLVQRTSPAVDSYTNFRYVVTRLTA